jgi:MFS family permease
VALQNLPASVANTAYQSLIADVIPTSHRAQAYSSRNRLMSVLGNVTLLGTGLLLDRLIFPGGYQIMFTMAFVLALAELRALTQFVMPSRADSHRARGDGAATAAVETAAAMDVPSSPLLRLRATFGTIRSERAFLSFALTSMIFQFGWQMCGPLFTKYTVSYLHANNLWISIISIAGSFSAFFSYPVWARWADRHGNRRLTGYAACGMALSPLIYAISHDLWTLTILNTIINFFVAGIVMLLFN